MKKIFVSFCFVVGIVIMSYSPLVSQHFDHYVSVELTEDCCWRFLVHGPDGYYNDTTICVLRLRIPGDTTYFLLGTDSTANKDTVEFLYCPEDALPALPYIDWKITFSHDFTYQPPLYHGTTYGGKEYDPEVCSGCPEDEIKDEWLKLTYEDDRLCDGCKLSIEFDIPDSVLSEYNYIDYSSDFPETSGISDISSFDFSKREFCVQRGDFQVSFTLGRSQEFHEREHPCTVTDEIFCSTDPWAVTHHFDHVDPCIPDCPDAEFENRDTIEFPVPSCGIGCDVEVIYTWREACDSTFQDIQVLGISYTPECDSLCSIDQIYVSAISNIIYDNEMGFDPADGDTNCYSQWRVSVGSCWTSYEYTYYIPFENGRRKITRTVNHPCDSVDCCMQPITVCRTSEGITIDIDSASVENGFTGCNEVSYTFFPEGVPFPYPRTIPCNPACDWNDGLDGVEFVWDGTVTTEKQVEPESLGISSDCQISERILADAIEIQLNCPEESSYTIKLFDLSGNVLFSTDEAVSKGTNYFRVPTGRIPSGLYIYTISIGNTQIHSQKVHIIK